MKGKLNIMTGLLAIALVVTVGLMAFGVIPVAPQSFLPVFLLGAVLSADRETSQKDSGYKSYPCGVDIIYKGGMVGINPAGYLMAFPLAASAIGYKFSGIAAEKVDNTVSGASAGDRWAKVFTEGVYLFDATSITQAMVGQMMYLVDDHTFDDVPTDPVAIPVGILVEYVSATSGWIRIDAATDTAKQPKLGSVNPDIMNSVTKTDNYTVLDTESGYTFAIATDAKVFTLPATALGLTYTFVNTGGDGTVLLSVSPNAADKIMGGGLAAVDNKDCLNTKATAKKYDFITIVGDGADGWVIVNKQGTWATEG